MKSELVRAGVVQVHEDIACALRGYVDMYANDTSSSDLGEIILDIGDQDGDVMMDDL